MASPSIRVLFEMHCAYGITGHCPTCLPVVFVVQASQLNMPSPVPQGAYTFIRHNEIRDLAKLLTEVCHDVCIEPHLQEDNGEMSNTEAIRQYVAGLKVAGLREELKKHNQPTHGNKAALGQRLQETLEYEDGGAGEDAAAMEAEDGKEGEAVAAGGEEGGEEEGGENAVGIQANGAVGGTFEDPSASGRASFQPNGLPVSNYPKMPPKKKSTSQSAGSKGVCCVCCQALSAKDEALYCDGACQQWLHRYCASVTVQQYKPSVTVAAPTSARAAAASGSRGK